jgi:hypothetical protein
LPDETVNHQSGETVLGNRFCSILLIASIATPAAAQTADSSAGVVVPARTATISPMLRSGELVRVSASRARLDGAIANFVRIDSNLVISGQAPNPDVAAREWAVPVDAVERLEVWRGKPRSKTRVVTGVVVGALVGAGVGYTLTNFIECGGACDKSGKLAAKAPRRLGAMIGAPIGGLLGGVVAGASFPRWRSVTLTVR